MLMRRLLLAALTMALITVSLHGLEFSARAYTDYYGLIDPATFYEHERARVAVSPQLSGSLTPWLSFRLGAVLYAQFFSEPQFIDPVDIIREAYIRLRFESLDLYLGQKFVNWGKVDILSPINVINHSDTFVLSMDNFFEASFSDILAQAGLYLTDQFDIELVYVPFFQPNRYAIDEILLQQSLVLIHPGIPTRYFEVDVAFVNEQVPLFSEWAHSAHLALNFATRWFDAILSYSFFRDKHLDFDLGDIKEEISTEILSSTHVIEGKGRPEYNRIHNIGMGISFYLEEFLVSSDIALKITPDIEGTDIAKKNSEIFWALQIERLISVVDTPVRLQVNGFFRQILGADTQPDSPYSEILTAYLNAIIDDYTNQKPPTQFYLLAHFDTSFIYNTLLVSGNFIYGFSESIYKIEPSFFAAPRVTYRISDYLSVAVGADFWWGGTAEGFLGRNEEKDNFFLRLQFEI